MRQPAAKKGDRIVAMDTHIVLVPTPAGLVPAALPHPFAGGIDAGLSANVRVMGQAAALVGSSATNTSAHLPTSPGTSFQKAPANKGTITLGSPTVRINGSSAARNGDVAVTCNDPADAPVGRVIAVGSVLIG
jgi:uncharacterized Zn-binding protein involved in type VI secretion